MYVYIHLFFFLFLFIGEEREKKERKINFDVREKHQSVASHRGPNQGLTL